MQNVPQANYNAILSRSTQNPTEVSATGLTLQASALRVVPFMILGFGVICPPRLVTGLYSPQGQVDTRNGNQNNYL